MTQFINTLEGLVGETVEATGLTFNGIALRFTGDKIAVLHALCDCDDDNCSPKLRVVSDAGELTMWERERLGIVTQEQVEAWAEKRRKDREEAERQEYERLKQKFETEATNAQDV